MGERARDTNPNKDEGPMDEEDGLDTNGVDERDIGGVSSYRFVKGDSVSRGKKVDNIAQQGALS